MQDTLQQPTSLPTESLGQWFAHARMENDLDQRDVARHLRLNVKVIQAIESDDFQQLGPPIFARGYLTRYAELLELPEQRVLERYKQLGADEPPPLRVAQGMKSQPGILSIRWIAYPLILALIGWLGWLGLGQVASYLDFSDMDVASTPPGETAITLPPREAPAPSPDDRAEAETPDALPPETAEEPVPAETATATQSPAEIDASVQNVVPTPDPVDGQPQGDAPTESSDAEVVAPGTDEPPVATGPPQLELRFTEDCWVDVKDANGESLLYGIKKSGTLHTVSGPAPFSLAFGNAPGVILTLNGNPVDKGVYVPKRGSVSRFVLEVPAGD